MMNIGLRQDDLSPIGSHGMSTKLYPRFLSSLCCLALAPIVAFAQVDTAAVARARQIVSRMTLTSSTGLCRVCRGWASRIFM
jgi:hypothetical protein